MSGVLPMLHHKAHGAAIEGGGSDDPWPLLGGDADDRLLAVGQPAGINMLSHGGCLQRLPRWDIIRALHVSSILLLSHV